MHATVREPCTRLVVCGNLVVLEQRAAEVKLDELDNLGRRGVELAACALHTLRHLVHRVACVERACLCSSGEREKKEGQR